MKVFWPKEIKKLVWILLMKLPKQFWLYSRKSVRQSQRTTLKEWKNPQSIKNQLVTRELCYIISLRPMTRGNRRDSKRNKITNEQMNKRWTGLINIYSIKFLQTERRKTLQKESHTYLWNTSRYFSSRTLTSVSERIVTKMTNRGINRKRDYRQVNRRINHNPKMINDHLTT